MDFFFAPMACSLATRIALYETGAPANFRYVDIHTDPLTRRLEDGSDYYAINPMGQVPAIRTDDGELLTENAVVLQYVADLHPESSLAPQGARGRYRLQAWLNFIATELHKATYIPLLDRHSPEGAKDFARKKIELRLGHVSRQLEDGEFLLDHFSVADCYLLTVLNWSPYAGIALADWPALDAYTKRMKERPTVVRAMEEEWRLYVGEQERMKRKTASADAA